MIQRTSATSLHLFVILMTSILTDLRKSQDKLTLLCVIRQLFVFRLNTRNHTRQPSVSFAQTSSYALPSSIVFIENSFRDSRVMLWGLPNLWSIEAAYSTPHEFENLLLGRGSPPWSDQPCWTSHQPKVLFIYLSLGEVECASSPRSFKFSDPPSSFAQEASTVVFHHSLQCRVCLCYGTLAVCRWRLTDSTCTTTLPILRSTLSPTRGDRRISLW